MPKIRVTVTDDKNNLLDRQEYDIDARLEELVISASAGDSDVMHQMVICI